MSPCILKCPHGDLATHSMRLSRVDEYRRGVGAEKLHKKYHYLSTW